MTRRISERFPHVATGLFVPEPDLASHLSMKGMFARQTAAGNVCVTYPHVLYVNTMKLSSSVLSTNVTQVCFSQCLIACLKIALWVPEEEIQEEQTVKAWLSQKSLMDFVWIREQSFFPTVKLIPLGIWKPLPTIALTYCIILFSPCA